MTGDVPTYGSVFSGIDGLGLGLDRAGWTPSWQVEIDAICRHWLAHRWPEVTRYIDIRSIDWGGVQRVDLLVGGFPCQPASNAGKRAAQADPRWLWPEFARAVRDLRPRLVLVENVPNLLAVNRGSAFGDVLGDLASLGYDAEWDCIPASAVGALHERDRVWLVAYPNSEQLRDKPGRSRWPGGQGSTITRNDGAARPLANASPARQPDAQGRTAHGLMERSRRVGRDGRIHGADPDWPPEPDVGRVAHGTPFGVDRLRALGNAVVPQVAEILGRWLLEVMP